MHYKNGREARNGDKILLLNPYGAPAVGVLYDARADGGNDCNGSIAPLTGGFSVTADLKNCLHLEDVAAATIPDSSKPATPPAAAGVYDGAATPPPASAV